MSSKSECRAAGMQLTEEQRLRITRNLQAAKALLARKCQREFVLDDARSPEKKKVCGSRPPLAELDTNVVEPITTADKLQAECAFEEFDAAILEEIDKLCEQNKATAVCSSSEAAAVEVPCLDMPEYLLKLNESQRDAALSDISKPLLVLAGPGSGKTSTMVARILTLLKEGVNSNQILGMTFTTAAATEMLERMGTAAGKEAAKGLLICTFHSFCLQLCRSHAEKLNRTKEFIIYGATQQRKAVVEATRLAFAENPEESNIIQAEAWRERAKRWQQFVTQAKTSGRAPEEVEHSGDLLGAAVLKHYEAILASCNALDYHDFISCSVKLLKDHSDVLADCQNTWPYLLVDEFQDTSLMQYKLLLLLGSHNRVTVVGDDDQSIFSFNGANSLGFTAFRQDFPDHKEVRLHQNYRSSGCIVEAARCLIEQNLSRCSSKRVQTNNDFGEKIIVRECRNEEAQCAFVVDEILENASTGSHSKLAFGNFAVLYRRQVTGKIFQSAFRSRKIPFNMHGVAFYRKKVVRNLIALLSTALQKGGNVYEKRVFKALYGAEKAETKRAVEYVEKHSDISNCSFLEAAETIFSAKVSGTFSRRELSQGRKVLTTVQMVKVLITKEQSLSSLITAVLNILPQKHVFETRAIVDESGGKLLNEDEDARTVLNYILDDVSEFLSKVSDESLRHNMEQRAQPGCAFLLKTFLDHIAVRETENFRIRKEDNHNSVTLTTMHQAKGLEWDTVFIVKVNELEIPLLHSSNIDSGTLEEERRLFYVAMTRARKKLYISYIVVNSQRQVLQRSRFLQELPRHLLQFEGFTIQDYGKDTAGKTLQVLDRASTNSGSNKDESVLIDSSAFLRGFNVEARSTIANLFHTWGKKIAFQDPKRLLTKVAFVIDERLRSKNVKNKDVLHALKCSLTDDEAFAYARKVIEWEKLPAHERAIVQTERQEHFLQRSSERAMQSAAPSSKQIAFLRSLGCTITPSSRFHASKLIEQYKSL